MKNKIKPFHGLRYNLRKFKSAEQFACWPYDIIDPKKQDEFHRNGEYNIIRVTLGREKPSDNPKNNKYTRAYENLYSWFRKGVLIKDEKPAFYAYQQKYKVPFSDTVRVINGFIGLIKLQDYDKKRILPHEDVLSKPLEDRFNLYKTTEIQDSGIYGLYEDKKNVVDKLFNSYMEKNKPDINYDENHTINHRFWVVKDADLIRNVESTMNSKVIYIADGHHRYHTMLNLKKYYREKYGIPEHMDHPVDYIMMFFVNSSHQGLTILPTHRILYNLKELKLKALLEHIKDYFHLKVFTFNTPREEEKERKRWLYLLNSAPDNTHSFGIYIENLKRYFLLTLKKKEAYFKMFNVQRPNIWKSLDVSIIHTLLINYILHITNKDVSNQIYIDYTKDYHEAIQKVKDEKYNVAIICNSTRINQILRIAKIGEKMPQKSTYFYPKILTGLVMYDMRGLEKVRNP
ncbi:MAG: DUF1015 domain-containing protein [bacterium]|nr:DUF1015 domain-containing protein [bacterium]